LSEILAIEFLALARSSGMPYEANASFPSRTVQVAGRLNGDAICREWYPFLRIVFYLEPLWAILPSNHA